MAAAMRILHLEDNLFDAELLKERLALEEINCSIDRVCSRAAFEASLSASDYDLVISDFSLPNFDGLSALKIARERRPEIPFIFLSGTIGEERAIDSLKNGAVDYILKDRIDRVASAVVRARQEAVARAELKKSDAITRMQARLLNEARDAIFVRDLNQIVTYWNEGAERLYGWSAAAIVGKKASELLYKSDAPARQAIWDAVLRDGEWTGELAQVTKTGKEIFVTSRRTLLRDASGRPSAVLNINTDITDKKALELQVLRSQRMDSIGALAGGIAHDLNNVLAPILMASELLTDLVPTEQGRRLVEMSRKSAQRGAALVKQILQFARGSGHGEESIDMAPLAEEIAKFASKTFPRTISVQTKLEANLFVRGDVTQLHQVLLNFCVNARDAMSSGGTLEIRGRNCHLSGRLFKGEERLVSGPFVEIAVGDTGTGIPPEVLTRIFEPFFTTKEEGRGTGLGLSTVASIVRSHRAYLEVETEVGKGSCFRVFLPAEQQTSAAPGVASRSVSTGNGAWVLLIDDEAALLEMTKQLLEAYDYHVLAARDGAEGLALYEANKDKIRVTVTDLLLPRLGGQDLIKIIRKSSPDAFIICLSGSMDESALSGSEARIDLFLRKPCSAQTLLEEIHALISREDGTS